ncbi:sphingomyelin phosphodiesterase [Rhodocollybia butyracea]|uniref:Sphingomyelin phosphodiesterase n=1 Tax=Rhodocollybia butyracea TaxID=206335 RepID=A0A9P5U1Z5_9AGAR|nr:sphingomyelin phosphodiesterase [Rhodocollybia butyracea]
MWTKSYKYQVERDCLLAPSFRMALLVLSAFVLPSLTVAAASASGFPTTVFTADGKFPTSIFSKYYNDPTATSAQPQPIISDPVTHEIYPLELTNPDDIPTTDTKDPHPLPAPVSSAKLLQSAITQLNSIANSTILDTDCAKCVASLEVAKFLFLAAPSQGPAFAIELCNVFDLTSTCSQTYGPNDMGNVVTQVYAQADVGGLDGQMICQNFFGVCPLPPTTPLDLTGWFAKPKPNPLPTPKKPSGKRLKVLHLSDFHLDPRYATVSHASCTKGLCCRANNFNTSNPDHITFPAPRFGSYLCDTPYALGLAALEVIPVLANTKDAPFDFMIFTGDLVSHDSDFQLSREYVEYAEVVLYDLFKRTLLSGPVYATLGNHDSYSSGQASSNSFDAPGLTNSAGGNYDHVAALWEDEGWLGDSVVQAAKTHYAAYSVQRSDGLRVISLNTNLCKNNFYNYIDMTNPDVSGMLRMLTDELQEAEDAGERVWIIGHVLSGWDDSDPLLNPTNLFYQIVDRYSPHIFYANNGTVMNAENALTTAWITPSITPLTDLNSGFRVYEIDSATFDIMDAYTWFSDVNSYPELDNQTQFGPTFELEYSTRETYGQNIPGWTDSDPLNATWWHLIFNNLQFKNSINTPPCTGDCINSTICSMRSGSASLVVQNCLS